MVKALHKAGIEVILDVVFNHTNEGNHEGPTINFKGFDNSLYYHTVWNDRQYYMDYSGCGNTLNCNHPITEKFIVECLEFWVREMHVDGFRFDEGSILARGQDGAPMAYPPVIWNIELSETLADTKIIAGGLGRGRPLPDRLLPGVPLGGVERQVPRRRAAVRQGRPGRGRRGGLAHVGQCRHLPEHGHLPINSINFVTCHDGFTLNDLVSYNEKHNSDNGEGNRDGVNDNLSLELRARRARPTTPGSRPCARGR